MNNRVGIAQFVDIAAAAQFQGPGALMGPALLVSTGWHGDTGSKAQPAESGYEQKARAYNTLCDGIYVPTKHAFFSPVFPPV